MEEQDKQNQELPLKEEVGNENVLQFLDSMDSYLTLLDPLSSTLHRGWLELASARHSMGTLHINAALLDLKFHLAATSLQVIQTQDDVDSMPEQPYFILRKWGSLDNGKCSSINRKSKENNFESKPGSLQLRHRGNPQLSELKEGKTSVNSAPTEVADQVQKEQSRSFSMFGTLVSPKLQAAQLSFETAAETLVETANTRLTMLSSFDRVQKELEIAKRFQALLKRCASEGFNVPL